MATTNARTSDGVDVEWFTGIPDGVDWSGGYRLITGEQAGSTWQSNQAPTQRKPMWPRKQCAGEHKSDRGFSAATVRQQAKALSGRSAGAVGADAVGTAFANVQTALGRSLTNGNRYTRSDATRCTAQTPELTRTERKSPVWIQQALCRAESLDAVPRFLKPFRLQSENTERSS
jgi:hypothetical protein